MLHQNCLYPTTNQAERQEKFIRGPAWRRSPHSWIWAAPHSGWAHGVLAPALGFAPQIGGVTEHLGQRHVGVDLGGAVAGNHTQDAAPAGGNVADDVAI